MMSATLLLIGEFRVTGPQEIRPPSCFSVPAILNGGVLFIVF